MALACPALYQRLPVVAKPVPLEAGSSHALVFSSLDEFGERMVLGALATGALALRTGFGGPGDIVTDEVGKRIPLIGEQQVAAQTEFVFMVVNGRNSTLRAAGAHRPARRTGSWTCRTARASHKQTNDRCRCNLGM